MRRIRLKIMFDGTAYHGWQRQQNGITVQEALETALTKLLKEPVVVHGCSRTDAGVHAREFVLHFDTEAKIPVDKLPIALGTVLPSDIRAVAAKEERADFHARFDALGKTYSYTITRTPVLNVFTRRYAYHYPYALDLSPMREAAELLIGTHDFAAFMAAGSPVKSTVRTIYGLEIRDTGEELKFTVSGNGFLYNMVRIIVGTLLCVGGGKLTPEDVRGLLNSGVRKEAGFTVPPNGLCLEKVFYREEEENE